MRYRTRIVVFCFVLILGLILFATLFRSGTSAASAILVPNKNVTVGWASVVGTSDGSCNDSSFVGLEACSRIDEGLTPNTADYVNTGSSGSGGEVVEMEMTSTPNVDSVNTITVYVHAKNTPQTGGPMGGAEDSLTINIRVNGSLIAGSDVTPVYSNVANWYSVSFNGSWSQSQLDSLQVQLVRNRLGSGSPSNQDDNVQLISMYADATYSPAIPVEQAAFRWFDNLDSPLSYYLRTTDDGGTALLPQAMAPTSDGGYVIVGNGGADSDVQVIKYNSAGQITWARTWGGAAGEYANSVIQTSDGGYLVGGFTNDVGVNTAYGAGGSDFLVLKYDSTGNLSWTKTWGGAASDTASAVTEMSDGSYAVVGSTTSYGAGDYDLALVKFTSAGAVSWAKTWGESGGTRGDEGSDVQSTADGGLIVAGSTGSAIGANQDSLLIKYDSSGTISWAKTWGQTDTNEAFGNVSVTSDGGYVVAGTGNSTTQSLQDLNVVKYDSSGNDAWARVWGISGSSAWEYVYDIIQTSDGGYAVAGQTEPTNGNEQALLLKLGSTGTVSWHQTIGKAVDSDTARSLIQEGGGSYIMNGWSKTLIGSVGHGFQAKIESTGSIPGCDSSICSTVSASTSAPKNVPVATPSGVITSPSGSVSSPNATTTTPTHTLTSIVESPIDVGAPLAAANTAASINSTGAVFRLRALLHASGLYDIGQNLFKLQVSARGGDSVCDTSFTGETYVDVSSSSGAVRLYDNPLSINERALGTNANDPVHSGHTIVRQTYNELNSIAIKTAIPSGQDGLWDFPLVFDTSATPSTSYCLRIVKANGALLTTYSVVPQITLGEVQAPTGPTLNQQMRGGHSVINGVKSPLFW